MPASAPKSPTARRTSGNLPAVAPTTRLQEPTLSVSDVTDLIAYYSAVQQTTLGDIKRTVNCQYPLPFPAS